MTTQELLNLKKEITEAKEKIQTYKGKKDYLMEELWKTWKCKTLKDAEVKLAELQKSIDSTTEKIELKTTELEKQLNDNSTTQD